MSRAALELVGLTFLSSSLQTCYIKIDNLFDRYFLDSKPYDHPIQTLQLQLNGIARGVALGVIIVIFFFLF